MARLGAEVSMVTISFVVYIAYHLFYFFRRGVDLRRATLADDTKLFNKGKVARVHFTDTVCSENDTIAGIQQNRNGLLGLSFLSGICSIMAQSVLRILTDEEAQDQIRKYGRSDPVTNGSSINPQIVLGFNFLVLMASILCFAQSVRMFIHSGFFFKAGAWMVQSYVTSIDAAEVVLSAHVAQTFGMRILFFFPVTALWLIGPTAMLITSVITTATVAYLDLYTMHEPSYKLLLEELSHAGPPV